MRCKKFTGSFVPSVLRTTEKRRNDWTLHFVQGDENVEYSEKRQLFQIIFSECINGSGGHVHPLRDKIQQRAVLGINAR